MAKHERPAEPERSGSPLSNRTDREFQALMAFIRPYNEAELQEAVERNLDYFRRSDGPNYRAIVNYYNKYKLWGLYDPENGIRELSENRARAFAEHREDFEWLYGRLGDFRSRVILTNILSYWLTSNYKLITQLVDHTFHQYFDLDLIRCDQNEVFVDIGAYIGDTMVDYVKTFGSTRCKRIYCYEILPANIAAIRKNIELFHLGNVAVREKGASDRAGLLYLDRSGDVVSSITRLGGTGETGVPTVTIDEDIGEPVTFLKMDIEGAEEQALAGCRKKIAENHPKLALSVYHNHKDLWKLARMIDSYDPSYRMYLRYYGGPLLPTEYLLYAI